MQIDAEKTLRRAQADMIVHYLKRQQPKRKIDETKCEHKCVLCNSPTSQRCSSCHKPIAIYYCTKECQLQDWKTTHRFHCAKLPKDFAHVTMEYANFPFCVKEMELLEGCYLVPPSFHLLEISHLPVDHGTFVQLFISVQEQKQLEIVSKEFTAVAANIQHLLSFNKEKMQNIYVVCLPEHRRKWLEEEMKATCHDQWLIFDPKTKTFLGMCKKGLVRTTSDEWLSITKQQLMDELQMSSDVFDVRVPPYEWICFQYFENKPFL